VKRENLKKVGLYKSCSTTIKEQIEEQDMPKMSLYKRVSTYVKKKTQK